MAFKQPNWSRLLTILLVILCALALLYITTSILLRFTQAILLFVMGAIVAYVLTPLVNQLTVALRVRWLAVLVSYLLVAAALFGLAVSLFTPFVQQSRSLIDNLHNPSATSLNSVQQMATDASVLRTQIRVQKEVAGIGAALTAPQIATVQTSIARLEHDLYDLPKSTLSGPLDTDHVVASHRRLPPNPRPQTQVPVSYISVVSVPLQKLKRDYQAAVQLGATPYPTLMKRALSDAQSTASGAQQLNHTVATTPLLLLRAQQYLDDHNIKVDLHKEFGQAAGQVSNQGTLILNNAITVVSETANILLDITLILIISFYLVNDGGRMIRGGAALVPAGYREQVWFFVASLDSVLGGYIRGQLFLAALAGVLGGGGAAVLGVPYPLLIGIVTALLELIPVIGPMIAVIPAVLISLFFMPFVTTVILLVWFIIFQQLVTNILGPRIMGMAVGIHPLEALLAVMVGYPLGGLLGAFLAVPIMGVLHILLREGYGYFVLGHALPTAGIPAEEGEEESEIEPSPQSTRTEPAVR